MKNKEELKKANEKVNEVNEARELNDEELKEVTGGVSGKKRLDISVRP